MSDKHPLDEVIDGLIKQFGGEGKYVTLIIGVLIGTKADVKETEEEFDDATNNLLCSNGFIKLSGFSRKKEARS